MGRSGTTVRYALGVINDSTRQVLALFALRRRGSVEKPVAPFEVWIDPQTRVELTVEVPLRDALWPGEFVAKLANQQLKRELAAPLPSALPYAAALAGLAVGVSLPFVAGALHPRVHDLAAPGVAVAGASVRVPYDVSGLGSFSYALVDERGKTVASGPVASHGGDFALRMPESDRTRAYTLALSGSGALGTDSKTATMAALPDVRLRPAAVEPIGGLSVDSADVADGSSIVVRYRTASTKGRILVRDALGTVWARARLNASGVSRIQLPRIGRDEQLAVELEAERAGVHATSSVGVNVVAATLPMQQSPQDFGVVPPPQQGPAFSDDPAAVSISPAPVKPGGVVRVHIGRGLGEVDLALTTTSGRTLSSAAVASSGVAELPVPKTSSGTLVVVATYDRGSGQESIVKTIAVR